MGWATSYIRDLQAGKTVQVRPKGNSMTPLVKSGQAGSNTRQRLAVDCRLLLVLIGNNRGRTNG